MGQGRERLCVIGLSHRTAPIEVRERLAVREDALPEALKQVVGASGVSEAFLVSTCNRVELYAAVDGSVAVEEVRRTFVRHRGLDDKLAEHLYAHDGEHAVRHLFRVASSLDSMVVGESQILGQVKDAFQTAVEHGTVGALLNRAVPRAFQLAKRIRTETDIARNSASIASVAADLAGQIFGELSGRSVLVVGAGKMGTLSARHLEAAGVRELRVVNRTRSRADELAARLGGSAFDWSELDQHMSQVDIVLCSTGAAQPVITRAQVQRVMKQRKGRWLFFIDIAVPRDVEREVGQLENVYLYDVDALEQVVAQNRAERAKEAAQAETMVEEEIVRFRAAERTQGVVPTIKALREHFLKTAHAEVDRLWPRVAADEAVHKQVNQLVDSVMNKLLHSPLTALKGDDGERLAEAVQRLFHLDAGETASPGERQPPDKNPTTDDGPKGAQAASGGHRSPQ